MKRLFFLSTILILFAFFSCSKDGSNSESMVESSIATENISAEDATADDAPSSEPIERKLIREGSIEFSTNDVNKTRQQILKAVEKNNGYVASDDAYNTPGFMRNVVVVRIPSSKFDTFIADATQGVEKFDHKNITVQDVTEEYLDISARLKTKKELEQRFLDLLQKANSVTEILEIEKEISTLRADIESIEGRLKYLKNQISYSTLTLTFYKEQAVESEIGNRFVEGFKNGWDNLIRFFIAMINIWPFLFLIPIVIYGINRFRKRRKRIK